MRSAKELKRTVQANGGMCFLELGSISSAIAAQKALSTAAIDAEVIKKEGDNHSRGCAYGIEFSCAHINNVRTVLGSSNIRIRGLDGI